MTFRHVLAASLVITFAAAGCNSARRAQGGDRSDRTRESENHLPTPAQQLATIDSQLSSGGDFAGRMATFTTHLDALAKPASRVANLRPSLNEIDNLRSTSVTFMGRRMNLWVALCEVSPAADALNPALASADKVVRRCEQIVRLKSVVASDWRLVRQALAKAHAAPSRETVAAVRSAAGNLKTRIAIIDKSTTDLQGALAAIEGPLRSGWNALRSIENAHLHTSAEAAAYRVGRIVAVVSSARSRLAQQQLNTNELKRVLASLESVSGSSQ